MVGRVDRGVDILLPGFQVRDVRDSDRAEVLAMTANTWAFGDYIKWVFDDWLRDEQGRFIAAEHIESGKLAAIDKMTFLSPEEAWFEGLRIAPEFRGRGLASRLQTYMIEQVRQAGVRTVRLLTSASNYAVQRMAYRDQFVLKAVVSFWKWTIESGLPTTTEVRTLRQAAPSEAEGLYRWWLQSSAYRSAGLCHRNWSFSETNSEEWSRAAQEGRLLVVSNEREESHFPPATVLVSSGVKDDGGTLWIVAAVSALDSEWPLLLTGLTSRARSEGVAEINCLFARDPIIEAALQSSRFRAEDDGESLCLFELQI